MAKELREETRIIEILLTREIYHYLKQLTRRVNPPVWKGIAGNFEARRERENYSRHVEIPKREAYRKMRDENGGEGGGQVAPTESEQPASSPSNLFIQVKY